MRIVIPGGTGQIGHVLARHFQSAGHEATVLSRQVAAAPWRIVQWDGVTAGTWISALEGSDVCINLAGRSVNCRYHAKNRQAIYDSRIKTTRLLNDVIANLREPPRVWLNASTATIYRHALDRAMEEEGGELGGNEPARPIPGTSPSALRRIGKKLSLPRPRRAPANSPCAVPSLSAPIDGAFDVFLHLVRYGLGGAQGTGRQFVSWIHEADFTRAIDFVLAREELKGVVNLAAPHPLPNREFMKALRDALGISFGLPANTWMIEMGTFLLRTESELVLKSRRVIPGRLLDAGCRFLFSEWPDAARDLVRQWRENRTR